MTSHYKEEIDWRDLIRKPRKLFGYSYIYVFVLLLGMGLLYLWNLNIIGKNAVPPAMPKDSIAFVQDIPLQSPQIIPPVDVMKAGIPSPEYVNKGRELFKANCMTCHGDNGKGDGPSAAMLNPKPRNFTALTGWKNGSKVVQIYKTLQEGIPGGGMAAYNYMPPEERFALIHFVRTLANDQPQDSREDLNQLDGTYQLAQGLNVAGQIPVKKAIQVMVKEGKPLAARITESMKQSAGSNLPGGELLRRVSSDEKKVFTSAVRMQSSIKNVDEFVRIVSADPIHIGFKPGVLRLSEKEWSILYQYVFSMVKEKE
jgi:mono/diheme cytochrome c family protein